ncbi:MAG: PilN domain-containing protein [Candidatus Campbellbacteria bacterium]|nr:PilN domain-containing protein [Candidatus Campbellbacteria bacterium]
MVNLLPIKNQHIVAWERRGRALLVVLIFAICSLILLIFFLAPSLILARSAVGGFTDQLVATKTLVDLQRRQSGTEVLTDIQTRSDLLKDVLSQRSLTSILQEVMPRIPNGVSLQQITYSTQKKEISVTLKGIAQTRNALTSLGDSLRSSPLFSRVDIPVSSLARSVDIDFTVTLLLEMAGDVVEYAGTPRTNVPLPEMGTGTSATTGALIEKITP